jgi:transposase-like protein
MDKELFKKLGGDVKNFQYLDKIFVELKKGLIEMMYDEEMKEQLGFERLENKEGGRKNYRNESYAKTAKSKDGEIEIDETFRATYPIT